MTTSYTYGNAQWYDQLTRIGSTAMTYNAIGNPLSYKGWTMDWQAGRELASMSKAGSSLRFEYNESGLRTKKTVGSTVHSYTWNGSTLIADGTASGTLYFRHDSNGAPVSFIYKQGSTETEYYYVKNLQGDVLKVVDSAGAVVASYT